MPIPGAIAVPHPPIIIPEIGRGEERRIDATAAAYRQAASFLKELHPDVIILPTPHTVLYADYFHISPGSGADGSFAQFRAPRVRLHAEYDTQFVRALEDLAQSEDFSAGTLGERTAELDHGTMVPLYFLEQEGLGEVPIVRIGLSGLSPAAHYRLGQMIQETSDRLGRRAVILASGDLSHKLKPDGPYGFAEEGPRLDREIQEIFARGDFLRLMELSSSLREAAAECGVGSFQIMAGALDGMTVDAKLLSYEGPFGVGYGIATFRALRPSADRRILDQYNAHVQERAAAARGTSDDFVRLARASLENYVRNGTVLPAPAGLPASLAEDRAGAFVSLKKEGRLRGCIGTIEPVRENLADEIIYNAVSAGTADPRFPRVRADELDSLVYSVDVLAPAEPATMEDLDAKEYGVIVTSGSRRGLLLPNLEGVDTPEEQVKIALQKGGISPSEPFELERFRVVRHK